MAIDLSKVEPLSSKSLLMEQALKRHQMQALGELDDELSEEFDWLKDDKESLRQLVVQMDEAIGQLAKQLVDAEKQSERTRAKLEKEQQLLFKQIKTLNNLLKNQVDLFSRMENQMQQLELDQSRVLPQVGVGLMAGLMSAVTILVTMPWVTLLVEQLR